MVSNQINIILATKEKYSELMDKMNLLRAYVEGKEDKTYPALDVQYTMENIEAVLNEWKGLIKIPEDQIETLTAECVKRNEYANVSLLNESDTEVHTTTINAFETAVRNFLTKYNQFIDLFVTKAQKTATDVNKALESSVVDSTLLEKYKELKEKQANGFADDAIVSSDDKATIEEAINATKELAKLLGIEDDSLDLAEFEVADLPENPLNSTIVNTTEGTTLQDKLNAVLDTKKGILSTIKAYVAALQAKLAELTKPEEPEPQPQPNPDENGEGDNTDTPSGGDTDSSDTNGSGDGNTSGGDTDTEDDTSGGTSGGDNSGDSTGDNSGDGTNTGTDTPSGDGANGETPGSEGGSNTDTEGGSSDSSTDEGEDGKDDSSEKPDGTEDGSGTGTGTDTGTGNDSHGSEDGSGEDSNTGDDGHGTDGTEDNGSSGDGSEDTGSEEPGAGEGTGEEDSKPTPEPEKDQAYDDMVEAYNNVINTNGGDSLTAELTDLPLATLEENLNKVDAIISHVTNVLASYPSDDVINGYDEVKKEKWSKFKETLNNMKQQAEGRREALNQAITAKRAEESVNDDKAWIANWKAEYVTNKDFNTLNIDEVTADNRNVLETALADIEAAINALPSDKLLESYPNNALFNTEKNTLTAIKEKVVAKMNELDGNVPNTDNEYDNMTAAYEAELGKLVLEDYNDHDALETELNMLGNEELTRCTEVLGEFKTYLEGVIASYPDTNESDKFSTERKEKWDKFKSDLETKLEAVKTRLTAIEAKKNRVDDPRWMHEWRTRNFTDKGITTSELPEDIDTINSYIEAIDIALAEIPAERLLDTYEGDHHVYVNDKRIYTEFKERLLAKKAELEAATEKEDPDAIDFKALAAEIAAFEEEDGSYADEDAKYIVPSRPFKAKNFAFNTPYTLLANASFLAHYNGHTLLSKVYAITEEQFGKAKADEAEAVEAIKNFKAKGWLETIESYTDTENTGPNKYSQTVYQPELAKLIAQLGSPDGLTNLNDLANEYANTPSGSTLTNLFTYISQILGVFMYTGEINTETTNEFIALMEKDNMKDPIEFIFRANKDKDFSYDNFKTNLLATVNAIESAIQMNAPAGVVASLTSIADKITEFNKTTGVYDSNITAADFDYHTSNKANFTTLNSISKIKEIYDAIKGSHINIENDVVTYEQDKPNVANQMQIIRSFVSKKWNKLLAASMSGLSSTESEFTDTYGEFIEDETANNYRVFTKLGEFSSDNAITSEIDKDDIFHLVLDEEYTERNGRQGLLYELLNNSKYMAALLGKTSVEEPTTVKGKFDLFSEFYNAVKSDSSNLETSIRTIVNSIRPNYDIYRFDYFLQNAKQLIDNYKDLIIFIDENKTKEKYVVSTTDVNTMDMEAVNAELQTLTPALEAAETAFNAITSRQGTPTDDHHEFVRKCVDVEYRYKYSLESRQEALMGRKTLLSNFEKLKGELSALNVAYQPVNGSELSNTENGVISFITNTATSLNNLTNELSLLSGKYSDVVNSDDSNISNAAKLLIAAKPLEYIKQAGDKSTGFVKSISDWVATIGALWNRKSTEEFTDQSPVYKSLKYTLEHKADVENVATGEAETAFNFKSTLLNESNGVFATIKAMKDLYDATIEAKANSALTDGVITNIDENVLNNYVEKYNAFKQGTKTSEEALNELGVTEDGTLYSDTLANYETNNSGIVEYYNKIVAEKETLLEKERTFEANKDNEAALDGDLRYSIPNKLDTFKLNLIHKHETVLDLKAKLKELVKDKNTEVMESTISVPVSIVSDSRSLSDPRT